MKRIVAFSMIFALLASAASAAMYPNPFSTTFEGKYGNRDASRIYTGYLADGTTEVTPGVTYTDPDTELEYFDAPDAGLDLGEGTWGIFVVTTITSAELKPGSPNLIDDVGFTGDLYSRPGSTFDIVGMFHGRTDDSVTFFDNNGTITDPNDFIQEIHSSGETYEIYAQPQGIYDPALGPGARVAVDKYETVGYDAGGVLLPGAELVLSGSTVSGFFPSAAASDILTNFNPASLVAGTDAYIELDDSTPWNPFPGFFVDVFPSGTGVNVNGNTANIRLRSNTTPGSDGWTLTSEDPFTGIAIPEPLTMGAFGLAFAGIGSYIRRRRR